MAIVSFGKQTYQSGKATIFKAEYEKEKVILGFEMENGKVVRETYRLWVEEEAERLQAVLQVLLGGQSETFDTDLLIGKTCYARLEERPWQDGRNWIGVAEVTPVREAAQKTGRVLASTDDIDGIFDEDGEYISA